MTSGLKVNEKLLTRLTEKKHHANIEMLKRKPVITEVMIQNQGTKGERPSLENSQSVGKWSATLARKRKLSENRPTLRLNLDQDGFAALAQSNIIIKNHFERGNNFTKCSLC